jgi:hypothetical protein
MNADRISIVLSVFAIVILSVIGALFKVRHSRTSPLDVYKTISEGSRS